MTRQEAYEARKAHITELEAQIAELNDQTIDAGILNQIYLDDCMAEAKLDAQALVAWGVE